MAEYRAFKGTLGILCRRVHSLSPFFIFSLVEIIFLFVKLEHIVSLVTR